MGNCGAETLPTNHSNLERDDMRCLLESAISKLPEAYRVVFVLRMVQDLPTAEVARDLEITESTVKVRLFRARAGLKDLLLRHAEELEALPAVWSFDGDHCDRVTAGVFERIRALPID